jgi:hypothetical protein
MEGAELTQAQNSESDQTRGTTRPARRIILFPIAAQFTRAEIIGAGAGAQNRLNCFEAESARDR